MNLLKSRQLLVSTSLSALVVALPIGAVADDIVIDGNNPATVDLNGGDTLTVTPGGSITPPLGDVGVESTNGNNEISNKGLIETEGDDAHGIWNFVSTNSPINNSGSIHTEGEQAFGIWNFVSTKSAVTNSGTIHTEGGGAFGIFNNNSPDSPITNSGMIHTEGRGAHGILNSGSTNSPINNSGSIHTEGLDAFGIWNIESDNSPVTNSGSIHTEERNAYGIYNEDSDDSPITSSGSIHTEGSGAHGIWNSESTGSLVTNRGSIHTQEDFAYGILNSESDNSPITNSGSIHTEGDEAYGIWNNDSDNSPVTNGGSIHTEGDDAYGIRNFFSDNSPVTNSGSIHTEGDDAYGIHNFISPDSPITNSGMIHTEGEDAIGINNFASDNSPVTNSGSIHTEGGDAYGIWNSGSFDSPVTNSGSIHTEGVNAFGIWNFVSTNSPVTNSGYVVSERSQSIRMQDTDGVLNLNAPGYLGGEINLDRETTVNLKTGKSHSVLWDFSTGTMVGGDPSSISGPVPWFYDSATKQFATYDPSGLAATVNQLGDMTNLLSQVGRSGLGRGGNSAATSYAPEASSISSYADNRVSSAFGVDGGTYGADLDPAYVPPSSPGQFWITGFGGSIDHDGDNTTLDQTIDQLGFAAGYSWQHSAGLQFNIMGGYIKGNIEADSSFADSQDIDTDGWFAGIYGEQQFGGVVIDFGVVGGWLSSDSSRFVNDNLALTNGLTLGISHANASYDSWFVAPEAGIAMDIGSGDIVYTPSARIRYAMQEIDGYTESGSAANAKVGSRSIGMIEANVEMAAARQVNFGTLTGRLGYLFRQSTGDDAVSVAMLGISNPIGFGDTDSNAAYLGVEADIALSTNTSLVLDGTGFFGGDMQGYQAMAKLVASF